MSTTRRAIRDAILADRLKPSRTQQHQVGPCLKCGRSCVQTESQFCSDGCRKSFESDGRRYVPPPTTVEILGRHLPQGRNGVFIVCPGCNKRFESLGLRYCSKDCQNKPDLRESMGPLAEDEDRRRRCQAPGCTRRIPLFRNGRAVPKSTKYCSESCGARARRAGNEHIHHSSQNVGAYGQKTPDFIDSNLVPLPEPWGPDWAWEDHEGTLRPDGGRWLDEHYLFLRGRHVVTIVGREGDYRGLRRPNLCQDGRRLHHQRI
jgi:hypothetical protein